MLKVLQSKPEVTTKDFPPSVRNDLSSLLLRLRKQGHQIDNLGMGKNVCRYAYRGPKQGGEGE